MIKRYNSRELTDRGYFMNFLKGTRGVGKTFHFKVKCVLSFLQTGEQFIWLRRYKTELKQDFCNSWFSDVLAACNDPDADLTEKQKRILASTNVELKNGNILINHKLGGYYFALTQSLTKKSVAYPDVTRLIFDEYLIPRGSAYHYLQSEFIQFMELVSTIGRTRNNFHVFCIGNNLSWTDPYSIALGMRPTNKRFTPIKNPITGKANICMEMYYDPEFEKIMNDTAFGQIVMGTEYGDYAIKNISLDDNNDFIKPRSKDAELRFAIRYNGQYYGVWLDRKEGYIYFSRAYDKQSTHIYALTREDHTLNTYLVNNYRNCFMMKELRYMYANRAVYFEDYQVKKAGTAIMALIG